MSADKTHRFTYLLAQCLDTSLWMSSEVHR